LNSREILAINIQIIESESKLTELAAVWNNLLGESHTKSVFLSWEWIETWWQTFHSSFSPLILMAVDEGVPCGIAPLVVRKGPSPRLEFFGQNKAYGEYLDFIVPRGKEDQVTPALCKKIAELHAAGKWQSMSLAVVLENSPNFSLIPSSLKRHGLEIDTSPVRFCPFVNLPENWEMYLTRKGKKLRKQIEYNERRLNRAGEFKIEFPKNISEVDEFFDDLIYLHNARWDKPLDDAFFSFHRRIAHRFFPLNRLLLARLRVGQNVVAAKYDFVFDNKVWGYQGGWLKEFKKLEVGSILLCEIFKYCISQEIREYDFLEGDSWYKRRWSTSSYKAFDLTYGKAGPAYIF